ncbi:MAG: DNA repair protein RecN [Alphaproteobacteria bacterium]
MLLNLQIKNVLLIENVNIEFTEGLCVLTGETGAGKSILLDSIMFVLGARSNNKIIRHGNSSATVSAIFDIKNNIRVKSYLNEYGFDNDDDLIIRRTIDENGKNKAFIGDALVSLTNLKKLGEFLIEIHGQNDQSGLFESSTHQKLLDEFGNYKNLLENVKTSFETWKDVEQELNNIKNQIDEISKEEDYLIYVINELEKLNPIIGEEEDLSIRRSHLMNKDKVIQVIDSAINELSEPHSVSRSIGDAIRVLTRLTSTSEAEFIPIMDALEKASIEIENALSLLQQQRFEVSSADDNIEEVEKRLFALKAAGRKYNKQTNELPEYIEQCKEKLEILSKKTLNISNLENIQKLQKEEYLKFATELSLLRRKIAKELEEEIKHELSFIKMQNANFKVDIADLSEENWSDKGINKIVFYANTNPGQEFGPIAKIASGGELSRFMLAIKVVLSKLKSNVALIFDEIDTGIGGEVANLVGIRLKLLAKTNQVLVVTHQPQIAAKANTHLYVKKEQLLSSTRTEISILSKEERLEEISRMLAGNRITAEISEVARQLIEE